jgi:cellulose synthase/poly-beta-1,6-N-acetylglucosamine synthase-like glycosyltransferase
MVTAALQNASSRSLGKPECSVAIVASGLLALTQTVLLLCLIYQYYLALASIDNPEVPYSPTRYRGRFAVVIPAHNEAAVLPKTLAQLQKQTYPSDMFDVHVVADHCTDGTTEVVRESGCVLHERHQLPKGRKTYAVDWLLGRILDHSPTYDAVVVFDADSLVDRQFLMNVSAYLSAGEPILQGQHIISNPEDSFLAALAAVDMRLNNRLRNQSRRNLGLSCRLMGDAMVFDTHILRRHGWLAASLTEDREYGYELLLRGHRVCYVPEARSFGQAASSWGQAQPQRMRWYQGQIAMQRRLAIPLLRGALHSRSFRLFDGFLELTMPSYSFLVVVSLLVLGLESLFANLLPSVHGLLGSGGSFLLFVAWGLYFWLGLVIDQAPGWTYRALMLGPVYLFWRLWIAVRVRLGGDSVEWIRTPRREEVDHAT